MRPVVEGADREYLPRLEGVRFTPYFVMGDHRSGTTILYKLLGLTGCFNTVTSYHILRYSEVLANHFTGRTSEAKRELLAAFCGKELINRGIDDMELSPDMPEEYGFVLSGTGHRLWLTDANRPDLDRLCKKIQLASENEKPLLLKNPWDYYLNFSYVKHAFPESKFVFIHRDPVRVLDSQLRSIRLALRKKNEYVSMFDWRYSALWRSRWKRALMDLMFARSGYSGVRLTLGHIRRAAEYFLKNVDQLPASDYVNIRYEDLVRRPGETIDKILRVFNTSQASRSDYNSLIRTRSHALLGEVSRREAWIYSQTRAYCAQFGYPERL